MKKKFEINYENGSKYIGEVKNGKRHAYGVFTTIDGMTYEGDFEDDKSNGKGTLTYQGGGATYTGEFKDNKPNGKGTYKTTLESYIGEFKNGKYHGTGTLKGKFKDGEFVK
jgi:hypothetical protein